MNTADMINNDIDALVEESSSDNEISLASSLNTQNKQNIEDYTSTSEKMLKNTTPKKVVQSKTFTVHKVKQVIKEENPNMWGETSDKLSTISEEDRLNLSKKSGINVHDDASYELAKSKISKDVISLKGLQKYNPSVMAKKALSTNVPNVNSFLPKFSLGGKTINSILTDSLDSVGLGVISPFDIIGCAMKSDLVKEKLSDKMGVKDYNKLRNTYKTLSEFSECTGLDDLFSSPGNDWCDSINDFFNTTIKYDFGWLVGCLIPVVEMLDIKSVNEVTKKVGAKGSIKVMDAITSAGNKDKLLHSVKKERATMRNTTSSFKDIKTKEAADNISAQSYVGASKNYYTPRQFDNRSVVSSMDDRTDVYRMKDIRDDSKTSRDFTDYSIGKRRANLLSAIPN